MHSGGDVGAEEALALFRATADSVDLTIWTTDAAGRCTFVNRACLEFFGTTPERMAGTSWRSICHPDDADAYLRAFDEATAQRRGFRAQVRVRRADGQWRWIETQAAPRWSADGVFLGLTGANPDVTDHRRREEAAAVLAAVGEDFAREASGLAALRGIARRVAAHTGAARVTAWAVEPDGGAAAGAPLEVVADEPGDGTHRGPGADPPGAALAARLRAGQVLVEDGDVLVPFVTGGRWVFLLRVRDAPGRRWRADELDLLADVVPRAYLCLVREREERAVRERYARAREVARQLQRALLPASLPVLPRAETAARYLVAGGDGARAGGDWFSALVRPDGRLALVVGDVVGHGVAASAVMGQLRAVLEQRLADGDALPVALAALARAAARVPGASAATVCAAVLDPATGEVEHAVLGHPPPLVAGPGGVRRLPATGAAPLTSSLTAPGALPPTAVDRLGPGELLLLHTDGLVERRGTPLPQRLRALADAAARAAAPPGRAAGAVVDDVVTALLDGAVQDDATVLAVRPRPPVAPLRCGGPALPSSVRRLRREVAAWLEAAGAGSRDRRLLALAAGEAVTNAVEHAYRDAPPGRVEVRARLEDDGAALLEVSDDGRWRPADAHPGDRGRGLVMVGAAGSVRVDRGGTGGGGAGTTVRVRRVLGADVDQRDPGGEDAAGAGDDGAGAGDDGVLAVRVLTAGGPGAPVPVRVRGPVDLESAPLLQEELLRAGRHGALPLRVDLAGVTHLASAGVRALWAVRDAVGAGALALRAPDGSTAALVLDLVALPRDP
ncbi:SpoIIE family protein phosphatase [Kineococcus sp. SYSU DK004]|uniref:SpoIIE family protein phosphatase n=1 Tax=Kineococcus sp. SYSU DK004 TaxID=3383125 RepID=UPI003D7EDA4A